MMRNLRGFTVLVGSCLLAASLSSAASAAESQAALCDNFGQDWTLNLAPCPAEAGLPAWVQCVTGTRDTNASLGCGGPLPLDGTQIFGVLSVVAYRPPGSSCVSTFWKGRKPRGSSTYSGVVSNEFGPFGSFTLGPCRTSTAEEGGADPAIAE